MKEVGAVLEAQVVNDLHEDIVERLGAILLLATTAFVCSKVLVLKVIVAEAVLLELLSR